MVQRVLLVIALIAGFYLFFLGLFPSTESPLVGEQLGSFEIVDSQNENILHQDDFQNKVLLINVWATWCGPCREEVPLLNKLNEEIQEENFSIVALMEDEGSSNQELQAILKAFTNKIPIEFPVYFDPNNAFADRLRSFRIPETFLVDKSGTIVHHHGGPITEWDKAKLVQRIQNLLE